MPKVLSNGNTRTYLCATALLRIYTVDTIKKTPYNV